MPYKQRVGLNLTENTLYLITMSRSYHQRHRDSRKGKDPREILETFIKDGKIHYIWRKRKIKPYGRKDLIGYGEETYQKRFGEYMKPVTNKKRERRKVKQQILNDLNEYETLFD